MTTPHTARQPKGISTGGQFAASAHTESTVRLDAHGPADRHIELGGTVRLYRHADDVLPEWPSNLPKPDVSYDLENGKVQTYVTVNDETVIYWNSDFDGTINNADQALYASEAPWLDVDDEDREDALEWGRQVHERIDTNVYSVTLEAAMRPDAYEAIVDDAVGAPASTPEDLTPEQSSAQRMDTALSQYPESQDDPHFQVRDMLTDLRHYAQKHDIDLAAALDSSYDIYLVEKHDPAFKEGI